MESEDFLEKLKKISLLISAPGLYLCVALLGFLIYKHYTNYKSPNHQEKIIGKIKIIRKKKNKK